MPCRPHATSTARGEVGATLRIVEEKRQLATWLISHRKEIEASMNRRLGPAAPDAASPEAEALRRFRSFTAYALNRGAARAPALDGLRTNHRRTEAVLGAWIDAAVDLADVRGTLLRDALTPLVNEFRVHLRGTSSGRKQRGTPRARRRGVIAAIDRVAEAFLAIDTDTGTIVDANPAAGSLLGVTRDALFGVDAMSFVPDENRSSWWTELDAMSEGDDNRRFQAVLRDANGSRLEVEASVTRFATRGKTLALVLMRPGTGPPAPQRRIRPNLPDAPFA